MKGDNIGACNKSDRITLILNLILLAVIAALDICYMFLGGTWLKGITSLSFVAVGTVNMIFAVRSGITGKYQYILPAALTVAMIGDIAINFNFIIGAAIFALGHVVYVAAYYSVNKFRFADLICAACVFLPSVLVITLTPVFNFGGVAMEVVCAVYALILSAMTGKAFSDCIKNKSVFAITVAVGSLLFYISDLALLINEFALISSSGRFATRILCLATYYSAQFLLAFSVYLAVKQKRHAIEQMPISDKNPNSVSDN